ncbi:MAG: hypothetical protein ACK4GO_17815 [Gemmobacter sp.]
MTPRTFATAAGLALAASGALAGGPLTPAAEPPPAVASPAPAPAWQVQVRPYVWATGLSGRVRPIAGAPTVSFSKSFSDSLKDLDAAFFLSASAERGRFVIHGDVGRVVSSRRGSVAGLLPARGGTSQTVLTLAAGYKAVVGPTYSVDVFAGVRAFWLTADVNVAGVVSTSPQRSIVDPLVGLRANAMLAPRLSGTLYADVGGFGVGTKSTVVLSGLLNYQVNERMTVSGGYRHMKIDYDKGGTLADVTLGGPLLGVSWRF